MAQKIVLPILSPLLMTAIVFVVAVFILTAGLAFAISGQKLAPDLDPDIARQETADRAGPVNRFDLLSITSPRGALACHIAVLFRCSITAKLFAIWLSGLARKQRPQC